MYSQDYWYQDSEMNNQQYRNKSIREWDSDDCSQWAACTERELGIPFSSCLTLGNFGKVTGRDLRRCKEDDFKQLVNNDMYGPLFYREFRKAVKKEKEEAASNTLSQASEYKQMDMYSYSNYIDPSNRTVPQMKYELEVPNTDYGLAYQGSSPCFSPCFSMGAEEPLHKPEEKSPTYFTQPAILSGGSVIYGSQNGAMNSFIDSGSLEYSSINQNYQIQEENINVNQDMGYSTLLPDFNSLMIGNKMETQSNGLDMDSFPNGLDFQELEASLSNDTFSDLEQLVNGSNTDLSFDDDLPSIDQLEFGLNLNSTLNTSEHTSLEESMLKKIRTGKRGNRVRHPQSWEFLIRLLMNPQTNPSHIKWEDKDKGTFRLVLKDEIAKMWGKRSQKHKVDPLAYDNFARIIRYHYNKKILEPVSEKHLVYKFGDKVMEKIRKAETTF